MVKNGNSSIKHQARVLSKAQGRKYTEVLREIQEMAEFPHLPGWARTYLPLQERLPKGWELNDDNGWIMLEWHPEGDFPTEGVYTWFFGSRDLEGSELRDVEDNVPGFAPEDVGEIQSGVTLQDAVSFSFLVVGEVEAPVKSREDLLRDGFWLHDGAYVLIKGDRSTEEFIDLIVGALGG